MDGSLPEHSPEPWSIGHKSMNKLTFMCIHDATGDPVAAIDKSQLQPILIADYERIVACVNACRGMPTEKLLRADGICWFEPGAEFEKMRELLENAGYSLTKKGCVHHEEQS